MSGGTLYEIPTHRIEVLRLHAAPLGLDFQQNHPFYSGICGVPDDTRVRVAISPP
jgi:hypothetical protein